ncbi:TetR/AcrR family transcriptional regulator [Actinocorallia sp. A-T 12471]|uniref:TetR/AcrR family transcriptional regulator n=1 Tax=Actinocorallia sp. A-T 12471 TaxID=3089813 RepID=UPI0029D0F7F3|nr:TetR/AcrR family transcriptional regulator [Actinocorallia sp. A-T 12471]MDX6740887.1 TetR/AcrR family transcriptional regulator [Actinocorallia sp. A-T 12471]
MAVRDRAVDLAAADGALRRVPTQSRARAKVNRALDAAGTLLAREGVAAVTLPRVAEEADVSVGALYQYLPDRDSILAVLSAEYHAKHEALLDALMPAPGARGGDPVGAVVGAFVRLYREESGTRALRDALRSTAFPGLARDHKERMVAKVHTLLAAHGLTDPDGPDHVARTVFFAADALMHEAFADSASGDPALLAELEALLRAYLAARPG